MSSQSTSIWKAKNNATVKASLKENVPPSTSQSENSSFPQKNQAGKFNSITDKKYQAKLITEEDPEKKVCLVKITAKTSIRRVIYYCTEKVKNDWVVTINAYQGIIGKALQACEIIKTKIPFLHQENGFITNSVVTISNEQKKSENDQPENSNPSEKKKTHLGISITLSRIQFEVKNDYGYQKPKPRVFMQPLPNKNSHQKTQIEEKVVENNTNSTQKIKKNGYDPNSRKKNNSADKKVQKKSEEFTERSFKQRAQEQKFEERKVNENPQSLKKKVHHNQKKQTRSASSEKNQYSKNHDSHQHFDKYQKGQKYTPNDSDFEEREQNYRLPYSRYPPKTFFRGASIDPRRPQTAFRGHIPPQGMRAPSQRYPVPLMIHHRDRPNYFMQSYQDYDMPQRPGFYQGNRKFKVDKVRNESIEDDQKQSFAKGPQSQFRGQGYSDQRNFNQSLRGRVNNKYDGERDFTHKLKNGDQKNYR